MDLKTKWHTRQITLEVLSYVACITTAVVIVPLAIDCGKLVEYGLGMYPGVKWPRGFAVQDAARTFWSWSVWPVLQWLPLTLIGDAILRRFAYGLRS
jgi:hypothetical protein